MAEQAHRRVVLLDSSALKLHLQSQLHALHAVVASGGKEAEALPQMSKRSSCRVAFFKDVNSRTSLSKFLWLQ